MVLLIAPITDTKAEAHIYISEEDRGLSAVRFIKGCFKWGLENSEIKTVINKVPISDFRLRAFMGMIGHKELNRDSQVITYFTKIEEN